MVFLSLGGIDAMRERGRIVPISEEYKQQYWQNGRKIFTASSMIPHSSCGACFSERFFALRRQLL
eukprot:6196078-Amphidinium_carterae.1